MEDALRPQDAAAAGYREKAESVPDETPRVMVEWLGRCRHGGVRIGTERGGRYVRWSAVLRDVTAVAAHLTSRGIKEGLRVGIRGYNCYEWLVADLALLSLGAIPVAFPVPDFEGQRNADLVGRFGLAAMLADRKVIDFADGPTVAALNALLDMPPVEPLADPPLAAGDRFPPNDRDVFTLAFSSGTAGRLKCLLLTWPGCASLIRAHSTAYPFYHTDRILIALPLSTFQQRYLTYLAIWNDCDVVLTTAGRFMEALQAERPTILLGPPNFYEFAETRYRNLGRIRRIMLGAAAGAGAVLPGADLRRRWRRTVYSSFHRMYGSAMRLMLVGSAPVRPATLEFFARAGFELYQIYGMTETGFLTWNTASANKTCSVGREVYPGSVYLGEDSEVMIRHPWHLCVGYEGEPAEEAAKVIRADNVMATGDLGEFDADGFLYLVGRKKNVIVTTGGQKVQLEDVEAELSGAVGVTMTAVFKAEDGSGLAVAAWYEGDANIARRSLKEKADRVNARLPLGVRISQAALMEGLPGPDGPLLNRNLKLNRDAVRRAAASSLAPLAAPVAARARKRGDAAPRGPVEQ